MGWKGAALEGARVAAADSSRRTLDRTDVSGAASRRESRDPERESNQGLRVRSQQVSERKARRQSRFVIESQAFAVRANRELQPGFGRAAVQPISGAR